MQDEFPGGQGDELSRSDIRLLDRAIKERWPLSQDCRVKILKRLTAILDRESDDGAKAKTRDVIAAAKAIISADRLNLQQDALELAREKASGPPVENTLEQLTADAEQRALERQRAINGASE